MQIYASTLQSILHTAIWITWNVFRALTRTQIANHINHLFCKWLNNNENARKKAWKENARMRMHMSRTNGKSWSKNVEQLFTKNKIWRTLISNGDWNGRCAVCVCMCVCNDFFRLLFNYNPLQMCNLFLLIEIQSVGLLNMRCLALPFFYIF